MKLELILPLFFIFLGFILARSGYGGVTHKRMRVYSRFYGNRIIEGRYAVIYGYIYIVAGLLFIIASLIALSPYLFR